MPSSMRSAVLVKPTTRPNWPILKSAFQGRQYQRLTECVITWDCGHELRKTRGVHVNQVFAAMLATIKLINIQLHEMANTNP